MSDFALQVRPLTKQESALLGFRDAGIRKPTVSKV